jgi:hypothetical protein
MFFRIHEHLEYYMVVVVVVVVVGEGALCKKTAKT